MGDFSAWVTAPTPANGGFVESFYNSLHTGESGNVTHYSDRSSTRSSWRAAAR